MAKNLTRKGLALGSTVALIAAGVVGFAAPAQASTLTVIPSSGTSTTFISGETFSVKVLGQFASTDALRWEIADIDTANETVTATVTGGEETTGTTTVTVTPDVVATTAGGNDLKVAVAAGQTASVTVRAYVESGDAAGFNAALDTTYSAPITLNFVQAKDVTPALAISNVTEADTTVTAKFSLPVNNEQLTAGDFAVSFSTGTDTALAGGVFDADVDNNTGGSGTITNAIDSSEVVIVPAAWSATDGFVATTGTLTALVKDTAVKAQLVYNDGGVLDTDGVFPLAHVDNVNVGTAQTALVVARKAATITAASVVSTSANASNASLLNSTFQVKATVKDGATTPAPVAGSTVTATITTNATLSSTAGSVVSLAVNGTTYTANSALPGTGNVAKVSLTTDANGEVVVTLATSGYTAAQTVTVAFATENLTAATVTSTQAAATYTATFDNFAVTTDGNPVVVPVVVYDQFGGRPANDYDVRAVFDAANTNYAAQATTASTSATSTNVALVNGAATLVITDNGSGVGVNSYDVSIEKRAAGGGYAGALTGVTASNLDVHIKTSASLIAGTVTSTGTQNATTKVYEIAGPVALSLVDYATYDATTVLGAAPTTFTGALTAQAVAGTVSTTATATLAAAAIPGASVTIAGSGLLFGSNGKYQADSITVKTGTNGGYSVDVYSHNAGKQTLTITSGAATATTTIVFANAAANTGAALTIDAPDYAAPGSTVIAKANLVDKYGNPVAVTDNADATAPDFSLTYSGPGLAVTASAAALDADGMAQIAYFLGTNDSGTITITARYDKNGDEDYTDADDLVITKTIIIGETPAPALEGKVNVGSFNGKLVVYALGLDGARVTWKVGGNWGQQFAVGDTLNRFDRPTPRSGVTVSVDIWVDGVKRLTKSVVTR
jgi:hypothetical protein